MYGKTPSDSNGGFTLVELMVALVVVLVVMAGVFAAYINMHKTQVGQEIKAEVQQNARNTLDMLDREIMQAGYHGEMFKNYPKDIQFSEWMPRYSLTKRIRYYLNGTDIDRQVFNLDGSILEDNSVVAKNVISLSFNYYNVKGDHVDWTDNTANPYDSGKAATLKEIRHITVQITTQSSKADPSDGKKKVVVLQADLYPINLGEGERSQDNVAPATPTGLAVIDNRDCTSLQLKWTANTEPDLAGYYIVYGTQAGVYTGVASVPLSLLADPKNPQYKLTGLIPTLYTNKDINPTIYYIAIEAFDNSMNYSPPSTPDVSGNPSPDITSFGSGNDTTLNPTKPAPPSALTYFNKSTDPADCGDHQIKLTWAKSPAATAGYRIYRSNTSAPLQSYPIPATYLIADETRSVGTVALDANTTSYIDGPSDGHNGTLFCGTWYYAICSINCDNTLVYGDGTHPAMYTSSSDYTPVTALCTSGLPPYDPDLSGSKGGFQRVFVNLINPVLSANAPNPSCPDFDHTNLYYSSVSMPMLGADGTVTGGQLVFNGSPDTTPIGSSTRNGVFTNPGATLLNSFVFNNENVKEGDLGTPTLANSTTYYFLAVAYDKCGNHSTATGTAQTLAKLCNDDPLGYPGQSYGELIPNHVTVDGCGDTMYVNWNWPTGSAQDWLDLQGFRVYRNSDGNFSGSADPITGSPNGTSTALLSAPLWGVSLPDAGIQDGGTYYYCVRATDCVWENVGSAGTVNPTQTYAYIKANNITPCISSSIAGPIYPGRIQRYQSPINDYPPAATNDQCNFVKSFGVDPTAFPGSLTKTEYNNAVRFYIQNTSAGSAQLNQINLSWGNSAAFLKGIRVGDLPGMSTHTDYVFTTPLSSADAWAGQVVSVMLSDPSSKATGIGTYSQAIPVTLIFTNQDGTVSSATDMRQDQINVQIKYKNVSTGKTDCWSFMDSTHNNPINVPTGPTMYNSTLSAPAWGTAGFDVPGNITPPHDVTQVHPLAAGGQSVWIYAYIADDETYTYNGTTANVGIQSADIYYATTSQSATSPAGATFTKLTGNIWWWDYFIEGEIPPQDGQRVWYYYKATSYSGNTYRYPEIQNGYFMYDGGQFDPCQPIYTPQAPSDLTVTLSASDKATLTWGAVNYYTNWNYLNPLDSITYEVYKKTGASGSWGLVASGLAWPGISGWTDPTVLTQPTFYYVVAKNSCTDPTKGLSAQSNMVTVCLGGTGCSVSVNPVSVTLITNRGNNAGNGEPVDLSVTICSRSSDTKFWDATQDPNCKITMTITSADGTETQHITLYEVSPGVFKRLVSPTTNFTLVGTTYISGLPSYYLLANDPGMWVQGATTSSNSTDTLTFTIDSGVTGCSGESASVSVTTDLVCSTTPNTPTGFSVTRSSNKQNFSINWTAPTKNTDGTTLTDLVGYKIYYNDDTLHPSPNQQWNVTTVAKGTALPVTLSPTDKSVSKDTYSLYITAYDSCSPANESAPTSILQR